MPGRFGVPNAGSSDSTCHTLESSSLLRRKCSSKTLLGMTKQRPWGGRTLLTGAIVSAILSFISTLVGCSAPTDSARDAAEADEPCDADVRNEEWDVDCSAACNHVMACKANSDDSNLETLSCGDCLGSCVAGVSLGGNDLVEGTDEDRRSWVCAAEVVGCSALDHNCDIF